MTVKQLREKSAVFVLGILTCFIILEVGLRTGGVVFAAIQEHRNLIALKQKDACRILCLGESTTALGGRDSYPSQLEEILNQQNMGVKFSVINEGRPGTNTSVILSRLEKNLNKYSPQIVVTMMGANDRAAAIRKLSEDNFLAKWGYEHARTYRLFTLLYSDVLDKMQELKKELFSNRIDSYIYLGEWYLAQRKNKKAEAVFKEAIRKFPHNPSGYRALGRYYKDYCKDFGSAKNISLEALKNGLDDGIFYGILGDYYLREGDIVYAKELFREAIVKDSGNGENYFSLAQANYYEGKINEAKKLFLKAVEIDPINGRLHSNIAFFLWREKMYDDCASVLQKCLEVNSDNHRVYIFLGEYYFKKKLYAEAEKMFKKALMLSSRNPDIYKRLIEVSETLNRPRAIIDKYKHRLDAAKNLPFTTKDNYRKLIKILAQRGVKLVCVQYPLRSARTLEDQAGEENDSLIIVDNETIFQNAIKDAKYHEYFIDFAGQDSGHCSRKGNRLLAENISQAILAKWFNKDGIQH